MAHTHNDKWYQLDNVAKIVPSTARGGDTRVFRIACELNEDVDPKILQEALARRSQQVLLIIFKLIQDFQILPLGLNPCFSTSFNQHHRRWMCILQHFTPNTTPFTQFSIKKLPLVYLFSKMVLFY